MTKDGNSDIAEVLGRIRARLQMKVEADLRPGDRVAPSSGSPSGNVESLHGLLASILSAHRQVGVINPRRPGLINSLIQTFKRSLRRVLTWYTRPIAEFQATTIQFLNETAEILGRDQSQLARLEGKIEILTTELAGLRRQIQARPDLIVRDPDKSEMDEK